MYHCVPETYNIDLYIFLCYYWYIIGTQLVQEWYMAIYKPQTNNNIIDNIPEPPPDTLTAEELGRLGEMGRDELISFIRCLPSRITGYALQTKEERREAMKLRVYEIAMGNADNPSTLKACNDWLDREDGKATQRIEQKNLNVNVSAAKEMTTEEIMMRLSEASPAALERAGVKLIGGKVERITDTD